MRMLAMLLVLLLPCGALAFVSGMDDQNTNIPPDVQRKLDLAITTYYQHPTKEKVETVLDIMNNSKLLRKKTSWPPMVGFLTVVFAQSKEHLFDWMSRNNYNTHAEDVFIAALLHAGLKETALVFAQAHQWNGAQLEQLRNMSDTVDLKHLSVVLPGHIDTLWGAFFGSGDPVYVNEILDATPTGTTVPLQDGQPPGSEVRGLRETSTLCVNTLIQYAAVHKPVRDALIARIASETDDYNRHMFESILTNSEGPARRLHYTVALAAFSLLVALSAGLCLIKTKRKPSHA